MAIFVKICGITRAEDAIAAVELGADAIGLNLFAGPRRIDLKRAAEIATAVEGRVRIAALTSGRTEMHPDAPSIQDVHSFDAVLARAVRTFQVYGDGIAVLERSEATKLALWMVYHFVDAAGLVASLGRQRFLPEHVVVDKMVGGKLGGTGTVLDWEAVGAAREVWERVRMPGILLAGGLTPENVAQAVEIVRPMGVDVSSGVEMEGQPGVKDRMKMRDFIQAARGG
jgi:phosphoribosylanthranilate isomerase